MSGPGWLAFKVDDESVVLQIDESIVKAADEAFETSDLSTPWPSDAHVASLLGCEVEDLFFEHAAYDAEAGVWVYTVTRNDS